MDSKKRKKAIINEPTEALGGHLEIFTRRHSVFWRNNFSNIYPTSKSENGKTRDAPGMTHNTIHPAIPTMLPNAHT
jgi:hypothetical protein